MDADLRQEGDRNAEAGRAPRDAGARFARGGVVSEPALELGPPPSGALVVREAGGVLRFKRVPWDAVAARAEEGQ